ncbi:MAG: LpqB family beta-propeller domain-containing protein [Kofleriaceae bacterium]
MKRAFVLLAACGAQPATIVARTSASDGPYDVGTVHVTGAPPLDSTIGKSLDAFGAIGSTRLLDISDDGKTLLVARGGDAMTLAQSMTEPVPVSSGVDVQWAAFGERGAIYFSGDRDGTEDDHLYRRADGKTTALVGADRIADPIERKGRLVWAQPGAETTQLWLLDDKPRKVFDADGAWAVIDLADDGTQLLARKTVSLQSSTLYRIDLHDGHAVALTSVDPRVAAPGAQFGSRGELFAIASAGDRLNVWELLARGQRLLAPELAWDVTQLAVSHDGATVAFVANEDGASRLYLYDVATHTHHAAPNAPTGGVISDLKLAAHAPVIAFSWSDPQHPRGAYTYDIANEQLVAWTAANASGVAITTPVHVTIGDNIHALVTTPERSGVTKSPVIVELHGGPEDQWLPRWSPFEQFLIARGFAIVQPNVRGSVGYGRAFAAADDGEHRGEAVKDVGAVLDWIATQKDFDPAHVAVMGTSYGGYLALASLIAYPDRFYAGIDIVGIADLVAFLEGTAPYRRANRRTEYGDERDPATRAMLAKLSPITNAAQIKTPLLVAHGQKDPRVPSAVSERLVETIRKAGGSVWYVSASDEGHGFAKPENLGTLQTLIVQLLERGR